MADSMQVFYGNPVGRMVLKVLLKAGLPKAMAAYLHSPISKYRIPGFIRRNGISMDDFPNMHFRNFAEFFCRERELIEFDREPTHLISPCDGYLSVFSITKDSSFAIKNSLYRIEDLVDNAALAEQYQDGLCLIYRLSAQDYHHYCFVDDGFVHEHHFREGQLHSVQPIACEHYPVYRLNRRAWSVMETEHFGTITQIEVGAMAVGGIVNKKKNESFRKGEEMGHFDLCGSTIVHLMEKDTVKLLPELEMLLKNQEEIRVKQGMTVGIKGIELDRL